MPAMATELGRRGWSSLSYPAPLFLFLRVRLPLAELVRASLAAIAACSGRPPCASATSPPCSPASSVPSSSGRVLGATNFASLWGAAGGDLNAGELTGDTIPAGQASSGVCI
jgi:hypothetical protein